MYIYMAWRPGSCSRSTSEGGRRNYQNQYRKVYGIYK